MKSPKLAFMPKDKWASWERMQNPISGAVHLRRGDELDDETACGLVIPRQWTPFGDPRISCHNCHHGTGFRDDNAWADDELDALNLDEDDAELLDMIAGDESDGVYHAMAWEIEQGGYR